MDTKKLRQKILDLAIRGKLVPQDPNDEPASVLLERIRAEKERLIKEGKIKRSKKSASDTPHYENVPYDLPEGWEWQKLGDIGTWQSGATPSRLNKDYYGGDIPWLKTGDLNDDYIYEIPETITQKALEETSVKLNPAGSVLIAMYGATIGKVGILTFPATTNQACCACVDYQGIEKMYLFYFLLSHKEEFIMLGGGGAQPNISKEKIVDTFIPIPPLLEQNRIVNAIEQWFYLIDTLETAKEDLKTSIEHAKSKILDLAIHGKLVPQDSNDEPAIELLKRINPKFSPCDNAHDTNQLPDSWCWSTLGDVCSFISGYSYSSSEYKKAGIPLVRISDINDGIISLDNCAYIQPQGERNVYLQKGDILIAMSGATTGKMGIYMNEESAILNQRVGVVRVTDSKIISEKYRDYFLYRKSSDILKLAYGGAQPNISGKMICSLLLPLPPYSEQLRIVAKIEELFAVFDEIQKSIEA